MDSNMYLIMTDERGDEIYTEILTPDEGLDEDEFEAWKEQKVEEAREEFPTAAVWCFWT